MKRDEFVIGVSQGNKVAAGFYDHKKNDFEFEIFDIITERYVLCRFVKKVNIDQMCNVIRLCKKEIKNV